MKYIDQLYQETIQMFKRYGDIHVPGTIIFYGPVHINPELMIIGENPGGTEKKIQKEPEQKHDYQIYNYPMADRMKKIFTGRHDVLFNSVKFNRIFFRSKNLSTFYKNPNWKILQEFSHKKTIEIINKLKPKRIITEGFGTFKALNNKNHDMIILKGINKNLIRKGHHDDIELLGLTHPSSTWGLSKDEMSQMNILLKKLLK